MEQGIALVMSARGRSKAKGGMHEKVETEEEAEEDMMPTHVAI